MLQTTVRLIRLLYSRSTYSESTTTQGPQTGFIAKTLKSINSCILIFFLFQSHVCIEQTAIDILSCGINVYIVADCCTSRLNQDRDLALDRLCQAGCVITTSESIIFNLLRNKNNPKFNVIRKLVNPPSMDMQLAKSGSSSFFGSKL